MSNIGRIFPTHSPPSPSNPPKSHSLPNSTKNFISPISSKRYEMPINLKQQTPQNPTHSPIQQKISYLPSHPKDTKCQ